MTRTTFSKGVVQRAASGKSTLGDHPSGIEVIATMETHATSFGAGLDHMNRSLEGLQAEVKDIWSVEKQISDLKTENRQYRMAISFLLRSLWAALDPMESMVSLLDEELTPIKNVAFFLVFKTNDLTNIWIQLSRRDLQTETAVAEVQYKVFRIFPNGKKHFLVVPRNVANLRKLAPRNVRVYKIKRH
jgi:hypothetical protein